MWQGAISPRARRLAENKQVDLSGVQGSGPGGRIIERDVLAALGGPAQAEPRRQSDGREGRVCRARPGQRSRWPRHGARPGDTRRTRLHHQRHLPPHRAEPGQVETIPVRGVRKVIAERMLASLQTTAQLTLHRSADARALLALRKRLKASDAALGLQGVTINDLVLFAVARTVPRFPFVNATFERRHHHRSTPTCIWALPWTRRAGWSSR